MKSATTLAAAGTALAFGAAAAGAAPVATYWVDASTQTGMAGLAAGGQPDVSAIMAMMQGGPSPVSHSLRLRLASQTKAPAGAQAEHVIPPALRMGPSLPLIAPPRGEIAPATMPEIKGKMLIYWGCGDHVGAGQPMTVNLADLASGKLPESIKRAASAMGRSRHSSGGPMCAAGFGDWPYAEDSRPVPAGASLVGPH